jgi:hypothetical protein
LCLIVGRGAERYVDLYLRMFHLREICAPIANHVNCEFHARNKMPSALRCGAQDGECNGSRRSFIDPHCTIVDTL